jgi:hypothetical protein
MAHYLFVGHLSGALVGADSRMVGAVSFYTRSTASLTLSNHVCEYALVLAATKRIGAEFIACYSSLHDRNNAASPISSWSLERESFQ